MKIMEIQTLLDRWHILLNEPIYPNAYTTPAVENILEERLAILHRLNELGEVSVDGMSIIVALEQTNDLLRAVEKARQCQPPLFLAAASP